MEYKNSLP